MRFINWIKRLDGFEWFFASVISVLVIGLICLTFWSIADSDNRAELKKKFQECALQAEDMLEIEKCKAKYGAGSTGGGGSIVVPVPIVY